MQGGSGIPLHIPALVQQDTLHPHLARDRLLNILRLRQIQGCRKPGFDFSKQEVNQGFLETQVILVKNLNLEVFFVLVLLRPSSMYGWQQGFRGGIIE